MKNAHNSSCMWRYRATIIQRVERWWDNPPAGILSPTKLQQEFHLEIVPEQNNQRQNI